VGGAFGGDLLWRISRWRLTKENSSHKKQRKTKQKAKGSCKGKGWGKGGCWVEGRGVERKDFILRSHSTNPTVETKSTQSFTKTAAGGICQRKRQPQNVVCVCGGGGI